MKKVDLIMLPFHDYKKWISEGFRTRDAHLFEHFKSNDMVGKVLVINRPFSLAEMAMRRRSWKTEKIADVIYREKDWQIVRVDKKAYYLDIFSSDFIKVAIEKKVWWNTIFNQEKIIEIINKACDYLEMNNRCILLQNPMAIGVIGKLHEDIVAFDAIDNWLQHPQNYSYRDLLKENYKFIGNEADVIFTVSQDLFKVFGSRENIYWVPNGVDKEFFSKASIEKSGRKDITIGYVGKIQDRIDFNLVEECLKQYKDYKFLFLGPVLSCKDKVKYLDDHYNNITFLGDVHYNELPETMQQMDIAIIPHLVNEFTNSMNPLKIYEYLAAGKQVVTTHVAGIEGLSEYVYIANSESEFTKKLKYAAEIYSSNNEMSEKIKQSLDDKYTWDTEADKMLKTIEEIQNNREIKIATGGRNE